MLLLQYLYIPTLTNTHNLLFPDTWTKQIFAIIAIFFAKNCIGVLVQDNHCFSFFFLRNIYEFYTIYTLCHMYILKSANIWQIFQDFFPFYFPLVLRIYFEIFADFQSWSRRIPIRTPWCSSIVHIIQGLSRGYLNKYPCFQYSYTPEIERERKFWIFPTIQYL